MTESTQKDPHWGALRRRLLAQSKYKDGHEWLDEEEMVELISEAVACGVTTDVILSCRSAFRSHAVFADKLSGVIGKRKRRILAVDDEGEFLEVLKMGLERLGKYEVMTLTDATMAMEKVEEFAPDLVVLDIVMPEVDGLVLAHQIREAEATKSIPIIMLTALLADKVERSVTSEGFLHLSKPISVKKLTYCIEESLKSAV